MPEWLLTLLVVYTTPAVVVAVGRGRSVRGYPKKDGTYPLELWKCLAEGILCGLAWPYFAAKLIKDEL